MGTNHKIWAVHVGKWTNNVHDRRWIRADGMVSYEPEMYQTFNYAETIAHLHGGIVIEFVGKPRKGTNANRSNPNP